MKRIAFRLLLLSLFGPDWTAVGRRIEVFKSDPSQTVDDDSGPNLLTVYVNPADLTAHRPKGAYRLLPEPRLAKALAKDGTRAKPKGRRWTAIWLVPKGIPPGDRLCFSVTPGGGGSRICSEKFTIREVMSRKPDPLKKADCPQDPPSGRSWIPLRRGSPDRSSIGT